MRIHGVRLKGKPQPCVECGKTWAMALDHRHYAQPLKVDPVCRSCNAKRGPALDVRKLVRAWPRLFKG